MREQSRVMYLTIVGLAFCVMVITLVSPRFFTIEQIYKGCLILCIVYLVAEFRTVLSAEREERRLHLLDVDSVHPLLLKNEHYLRSLQIGTCTFARISVGLNPRTVGCVGRIEGVLCIGMSQVKTADDSYSDIHQSSVIVHELAHVILGHQNDRSSLPPDWKEFEVFCVVTLVFKALSSRGTAAANLRRAREYLRNGKPRVRMLIATRPFRCERFPTYSQAMQSPYIQNAANQIIADVKEERLLLA